MRSRLSITARLAVLFSVAASIVLIGLGLYLTRAIEHHFEETDLAELKGKLELTANLLAHVTDRTGLDRLPEQLDAALVGHHNLSVVVALAQGDIVFASAGANYPGDRFAELADRGENAPSPLAVWANGPQVFRGIGARIPIGIAGASPARVVVAIEISHHREFMAAFQRAQWLAIALGIVLTALLAWSVARRGLYPLHRLTEDVRGISAQRLDYRLDVSRLPVELVDLGAAFNDTLGRLEDSFQRLSDFSSDISHELRTPVSNLMTQTEVALSKARSAEEYRDILHSNLEEYERMARMVGDMLFLAKADNGLVTPSREPVDLADTVQDLFEFYEALAEDKGIILAQRGHGEVLGDRLMLRRAVSNLVANAIRHTPRGGTLRVTIDAKDHDMVGLAVENPGPEIPPEHLPRIFDRFYRADPSRQRDTEGAGLGLAITRSIVEAHGGSISVTSKEGLTRFEVRLPAAPH